MELLKIENCLLDVSSIQSPIAYGKCLFLDLKKGLTCLRTFLGGSKTPQETSKPLMHLFFFKISNFFLLDIQNMCFYPLNEIINLKKKNYAFFVHHSPPHPNLFPMIFYPPPLIKKTSINVQI